jgi:hypothetical protein
MIYTIGYERLSVDFLGRLLTALDATLIDCRSVPWSRKSGWTGAALAARFGARYEQRGRELGGKSPSHTTRDGIARLIRDGQRRNLMLMCMEEAPGDCHRHHAICGPHMPDAIHVFGDELVEARELQRAIDEDDGYELFGSVADLLRKRA